MQHGFADSTVDATMWLIKFHPERLDAWLKRHPPSSVLYAVAQAQIELNRIRREQRAKASQPQA
jgi:hypothetical protein